MWINTLNSSIIVIYRRDIGEMIIIMMMRCLFHPFVFFHRLISVTILIKRFFLIPFYAYIHKLLLLNLPPPDNYKFERINFSFISFDCEKKEEILRREGKRKVSEQSPELLLTASSSLMPLSIS